MISTTATTPITKLNDPTKRLSNIYKNKNDQAKKATNEFAIHLKTLQATIKSN